MTAHSRTFSQHGSRHTGGAEVHVLRREVEAAFLAAGRSLVSMDERIEVLTVPLGDLVNRAPTVLDAVGAYANRLQTSAGALDTDLLAGARNVTELRSMIEKLGATVTDIGRKLKTMKFVATNARIYVFSLSTRHMRLEAFAESARDLVGHSDAIVTDVATVTECISDCLAVLAHRDLPSLRREVAALLPQFAEVGQMVSAFRGERRNETAFGRPLASTMDRMKDEFGQLIVSLQAGDRASQRIDHAGQILDLANAPGGDPALAMLAQAQLAGAHADLAAETENILMGLRDGVARFEDIAGSSGAGSERHRLTLFEMLHDRVRSAEARVDEIRHRRTVMLEASELLLSEMERLRKVLTDISSLAEDLRLVGTNAVLACGELGDDGDALREIATQLRHLAAGAAGEFGTVWRSLAATDKRISSLVEGIRSRLATAIAEIETSGSQMAVELEDVFSAGKAVSQGTGQLLASLRETVPQTCEDLQSVLGRMGRIAESLRDAEEVAPLVDPDPELLRTAWDLYTMDAERVLHRDFCDRMRWTPPPDCAVAQVSSAEDVFF
ncbi:hypothetical protein DSD19_02655 [Rhodovulum sp. BSW8]|uniref:hypothetical protein n=1 Tax=Rhodovulum sp. BSW8 TaxID=2259645 RepID=UPI000DE3A93B|nr:hypothetical protein [Rhodovulum sp. BSW8]RBO54312.1 hypothetical protein DSD19_02655 [Rhodovulum sp. BSW8]